MVDVTGELKRKSAEIGAEIDDLRKRLSTLEQQRAAFDVVIQTYEPGYAAAASLGVVRRRGGEGANGISALFKDFDRRSFTLRTLRQAGRPITMAECGSAFAREIGLEEGDPGMGNIGNRFSQVLDQLAKTNRIRRAGMADGHRISGRWLFNKVHMVPDSDALNVRRNHQLFNATSVLVALGQHQSRLTPPLCVYDADRQRFAWLPTFPECLRVDARALVHQDVRLHGISEGLRRA
ncbi:hypothetical protein [Rhizobium sp. BK176]|uniref:hypothetical protein n=1 Tax=Rhizobium sp. BK176 TaxID=2587071 RepID=UPI002169890D|nr:hypothetical protein [Rhizobium sp. BK176]MCS4095938.1 hypothetical protein [Rhizobium sp. BK176]